MKSNFIIYGVGIVTFLICLLDYALRLGVAVDSNKAQALSIVKSEVNVAFLDNTLENQILELLNQYDVVIKEVKDKVVVPEKTIKPKIELMSKEQQNLQSGKLTGLFDGEDEYKLIATFYDSKRRFALLKKTHLPSSKTSQIRIYEGELMSGYRLEKVNTDFVSFFKQKREIQLQLFSRKAKI